MLKFCVVALLVGVSAVNAFSVNKREFTEDATTQANEGCSDTDPCTNGGTCVNGSCNCISWTSGNKCEVVEKCGGKYKIWDICGYGPEVICAYNETSNIPYCACEDEDKGYDTELKECRRKCGEDKDCSNGGKCVNNICECLPGTKGDKCNIIEKCAFESEVIEFCGTLLARCKYNQTTRLPYCTCVLPKQYAYDAEVRECIKCKCGDNSEGCQFPEGKKICNCSWGYIQNDKGECVGRCNDDQPCSNNGTCVNGSCNCIPWTSGDRCEVVEKCAGKRKTWEVCGYAPGVKCAYNETSDIPYCACEDEDAVYVAELKKCIEKCGEDKDCLNGGKCVNNFCECLPGTKGDKCNVIEKCADQSEAIEFCGTFLARCRYNQTTHLPYCECILSKQYAYDAEARECIECKCGDKSEGCQFPEGKKICNCSWGYIQNDKGKCEGRCSDDQPCSNNGTCVNGSCNCIPWTSGERCEVVEKCAGKHKTWEVCGYGPGVKCAYNETSDIPYCACEDEDAVYVAELKRCIKTCGEDKDCSNGGKCLNNFCECLPGTKGEKCNVIEKCADKRDVIEFCGTFLAECRYNQTTHLPYCTCILPKTYAYDAEARECIACKCGYNSDGCQFQEGKKICNCSWGYIQSDKGRCEVAPCDCGPHGSCHFEEWKTVCDCYKGFVDVNGTCEVGSSSTDGSSIMTTTNGSTTDASSGVTDNSSLETSNPTQSTLDASTGVTNDSSTTTFNPTQSTLGPVSGATDEISTKPSPMGAANHKSWRTGTIILGILFAICLIGVIAVFLKLRSPRRFEDL